MRSVSRLLWPLYLFLLTWIVLPVYATIIAGLLPLSDADIDRFLTVVVVGAALLEAYIAGYKETWLIFSTWALLLAGGFFFTVYCRFEHMPSQCRAFDTGGKSMHTFENFEFA